ncbi:6-bladed beta-propeller [Puteibacter caeruleilacunae]|nr:6-bladed beta-propeller [Puteibacter caeruleilacunae]
MMMKNLSINFLQRSSLLLLLLIVCNLISCNRSPKEREISRNPFFIVDIERDIANQDTLALSAIADSVTVIPLETSDKCLISKVVNLAANSACIFVRTVDRELFVFNRDGTFLSKIGNRGRGPKEYRKIIHFDVDEEYVYLLDYGRILQYKLSGELVNVVSLPKLASRIVKLQDDRILLYIPDSQFRNAEDQYSFLVTNTSGDSLKIVKTTKLRDYSKEKVANNYVQIGFSRKYNIAYNETFNDTLFHLNPATWEKRKFGMINYGIHGIKLNMPYKEVVQAPHNLRINSLIDLNNYLLLHYACQCMGNNVWYWAVYNKEEDRLFNLIDRANESRIINDLDDGPNLHPFCIDNNEIMGLLYAYETPNFSYTHNGKKKKICDNDNPIVMIARLKE